MVDVAATDDLLRLALAKDSEIKTAVDRDAVARLRTVVEPYERRLVEQQALRDRRDIASNLAEQRRATAQRLSELMAEHIRIMGLAPQGPRLRPRDTVDLGVRGIRSEHALRLPRG
jgi:cytochrome c-type biogenesis protein CcmH/NrfG